MDTVGIIKLSDFVDGLVFKDKNLSKNDRTWVFEHTVDVIRNFNMLHTYSPIHLSVTPNENMFIDYPMDCIGICSLNTYVNGEYYPLPERENISVSTTIKDGQEIFDKSIGQGLTYDSGATYGFGTVGGVYSTYFVKDNRKRRLLLNGQRIENLVLIYITSGISTTNETYIPAEAKLMLEYAIKHQLGMFGGMNLTQYDRELIRREMEDQELKYRSFILSFDESKFVDALTSVYGLTIKR